MINTQELSELKKQHFDHENNTYFGVDYLIEKIIDSIGICGDCKHHYEHYKSSLKGTYWCDVVCGEYNNESRQIELTWYCGDFKRIDNE